MSEKIQRKLLLDDQESLKSNFEKKYIEYFFDVPDNASKVGLTLTYRNEFSETNPNKAVMFVSLHDPNGFRGHRMNPGGRGDVVLELWAAPNSSSEGAIPGALPSGQWRAQIDIRALKGDADYGLQIYIEEGDVVPASESKYPDDRVVKPESGWYKGELHAHSTESDGKFPVEEVVKAAVDYGLDFFSLTDHTTSSQWHKLGKLIDMPIALIRSLEITSHVGHANIHGISDWVNVYIDKEGWSVNQAAEEVHRQGGLFCINHAFSGYLSWRDFDLDWNLVDMEEIYHNLEGANNSHQLALWDHHLGSGYRIVGVAGTDSHNPFEGLHEFGQVHTYVYADELSEWGIVEGIKRGIVYISRGPQMRFTAFNESGLKAEMWESLPVDTPITFEAEFQWDKPLVMFVIKNGMIFDVFYSNEDIKDWQKIAFTDENPKENDYYRIELHDVVVNKPYTGIIWRDYSTMRVLSNPIWAARKKQNNGLTGVR
ncbi:MAG: CehA/McbA family metallohydrolase [Anaerolineaceae bacterium]|jgi:hypothetical protein|nr:CehA/McbA family metallohydrolase [Anaerolineaceae bacterium]